MFSCRRATPIENLVIQSQSIIWRIAFPRKEEAFWPFLARRDRELKTRVRINLTAAAQSFVWNI